MRKMKFASAPALSLLIAPFVGIASFATTDAEETVKTFGERTIEALTNSLLGMLVVFSVLTIIFIVIKLVGLIFVAKDKKAAEKVKTETTTKIEEPTAKDGDDGELAAAIIAAISMYRESENIKAPAFRVVSYKKATTKPAWNGKQ